MTTKPLTAIVDTNVIMAMYSIHDVLDEKGKGAQNERWRGQQAAESLRLAIYLHEQQARTLSYPDEVADTLEKRVDPGTAGTRQRHIRLFAEFVYPVLLHDWDDEQPAQGPDGKYDDAYLDLAIQNKTPLITWEGHKPGDRIESFNKKKKPYLRKRVLDAAGQAMTPGEFCAGKITQAAVNDFLRRFAEKAPSYEPTNDPVGLLAVQLPVMFKYYKRVLRDHQIGGVAQASDPSP